MKLTHASVFSGIGGPEIAATMLGWENVFHCEINDFGRKILEYWYPNSRSYEDITKTDFTEWRGRVDVLTGGFPCQPFSYAGQRRGAEDDRYLWPYMFRCIDQIQPDWVVAENVAGITTMVEQGEVSPMESQGTLFDEVDAVRRYRLRETFTLQRICDDLEGHGYEVQPVLVPACAVGAPHRRDRVFIVARRKEESAAADSVGSGERASRPSGEPESGRGDTHQQPSERRAATERLDRLHAVLRPSADTDSVGRSERRSETDGREHDRIRAQVFGIAERQGSSGATPHPDSHRGSEVDEHMESELADGAKPVSNGGQRNVADTIGGRISGCSDNGEQSDKGHHGQHQPSGQPFGIRHQQGWVFDGWRDTDCAGLQRWANFPTVSPVHRGNDGLPFSLDDLAIPASKWRTESLKAYGNAIVPQVMYEIFRAIEIVEREKNQ